jgi:RHS repeat-associated protein
MRFFSENSMRVDRNSTTEKSVYYIYDGVGQRVRKVIETQNGTRKQERIYLGGFEVYREYNGNGAIVTLERETLHIMDDKQRIALGETKTVENGAQVTNPQPIIRYQLGNHLGSGSLELDASAGLISYEEYYPYGTTSFQAMTSAAEGSLKRYRYTSVERDEETGFSYHGARYFLPWMGRWLSADPIGVEGGLNLYEYCESNPIIFSDITGNERSITEINRTFDQGIGDKKITLDELAAGIGSTPLSLKDWASMMVVDTGGYRVDKDVQTIIDILAPDPLLGIDPLYYTIDLARQYEYSENAPQWNSEGGYYTNRTGREATKRELHKYSDPKRIVATLEVTAAVLAPEYYFTARSIYHSATGHPEEAILDLGGVLLGSGH